MKRLKTKRFEWPKRRPPRPQQLLIPLPVVWPSSADHLSFPSSFSALCLHHHRRCHYSSSQYRLYCRSPLARPSPGHWTCRSRKQFVCWQFVNCCAPCPCTFRDEVRSVGLPKAVGSLGRRILVACSCFADRLLSQLLLRKHPTLAPRRLLQKNKI